MQDTCKTFTLPQARIYSTYISFHRDPEESVLLTSAPLTAYPATRLSQPTNSQQFSYPSASFVLRRSAQPFQPPRVPHIIQSAMDPGVPHASTSHSQPNQASSRTPGARDRQSHTQQVQPGDRGIRGDRLSALWPCAKALRVCFEPGVLDGSSASTTQVSQM